MGAKSKLIVSEHREGVLSLVRREEAANVAARRYGICENTLYRWGDEFMTAGAGEVGTLGDGKLGLNWVRFGFVFHCPRGYKSFVNLFYI